MKLVGRNNDGTGERMEVLELEKDAHPYFMGAQVCESVIDLVRVSRCPADGTLHCFGSS